MEIKHCFNQITKDVSVQCQHILSHYYISSHQEIISKLWFAHFLGLQKCNICLIRLLTLLVSGINPFTANIPFLYRANLSENSGFLMFQGILKWSIGFIRLPTTSFCSINLFYASLLLLYSLKLSSNSGFLMFQGMQKENIS